MRLREIRENSEETQTEVAKYLGVTRQAYNNYELGNRQLNPDMLDKLADYFNVTTDYLLGREDKTTLTTKDKKEITEILESTRQQLLSQEGLMFDGEPASEEDVQKIIMAMQMGMEMIKKENKEKYTPKKYRK